MTDDTTLQSAENQLVQESDKIDPMNKGLENSGLEYLLMENNKLLKQQILTTRILTGLVCILLISLFVGGSIVANKLKSLDQVMNGIDSMTQKVADLDVDKFNQTIQEFGENVSKLDIDGFNDTIDTLNNMAAKVDEVNRDLENFTSQFGFLFGG